MSATPQTKAAAPRQGKAALESNLGRGHSPPAKNCKRRFATRQEHAEEAARQLVYSWCEFGRHAVNDVPPDRFPNITLRTIAERLASHTEGTAIGWPDALPLFSEEHLRTAFIECTDGMFPPSPDACRPLVDSLRAFYVEKRKREIADAIRQAIDSGDEIGGHLAELAKIEAEAGTETGIAATLEARAFNFDSPQEKPIPIFTLAGMPLCTAGNITNIQAPPKAGKSAAVDAMLAAVLNGNRQGPDTLGFSAENPHGHALLHFDTEQSRFDADALVRRACRRARVERPPAWFHSYAVADLDIHQRRQGLRHAMAVAKEMHGGIFAVLIDGVGDLCADPNDSEESFALVHELHTLAIRHHCTIVTVLHENPGSESGKTRGHLGSQLERKAETNLRLAKDKDGITTIWAERARHCYIPKEQGQCFAWNAEAMMHVSCGTAGEIRQAANREKMEGEADAAFGGSGCKRHSELMAAIGDALDLKERAAKRRIQTWHAEGIIWKDSAGNYHLSDP